MSELETLKGKEIYDEIEYYVKGFEPKEVDDKVESLLSTDYYLKSDADKVIAEKDKELRRHKHKRCLDKAEMCKARYDEEDARVNGRGASWDYTRTEMKYWERWHKRWLALAEKFKEAK